MPINPRSAKSFKSCANGVYKSSITPLGIEEQANVWQGISKHPIIIVFSDNQSLPSYLPLSRCRQRIYLNAIDFGSLKPLGKIGESVHSVKRSVELKEAPEIPLRYFIELVPYIKNCLVRFNSCVLRSSPPEKCSWPKPPSELQLLMGQER